MGQTRYERGWTITFDEFIDELKKSQESGAGAFQASANDLASADASSTSSAPPQLRDLPARVRLEPHPPPLGTGVTTARRDGAASPQ